VYTPPSVLLILHALDIIPRGRWANHLASHFALHLSIRVLDLKLTLSALATDHLCVEARAFAVRWVEHVVGAETGAVTAAIAARLFCSQEWHRLLIVTGEVHVFPIAASAPMVLAQSFVEHCDLFCAEKLHGHRGGLFPQEQLQVRRFGKVLLTTVHIKLALV
jgi:hypothetical protein